MRVYLLCVFVCLLTWSIPSWADDIKHATTEDIAEFDQFLANQPEISEKPPKPGKGDKGEKGKGEKPAGEGKGPRPAKNPRAAFKGGDQPGQNMGQPPGGKRPPRKGPPRDDRERGRRNPPPKPGGGGPMQGGPPPPPPQ